MVFPTKLGSDSMIFNADADMKRVGGPVRLQSAQEVQIKVYVDHSAVEVFMSTGEALTTRYELHQQHNRTCPQSCNAASCCRCMKVCSRGCLVHDWH